MTKWGGKITDISLTDLQDLLATTDDDAKAVKRLVAAIAYKHGHSPAEIEEMFGFSRQNVYRWLNRIEDRGLPDGLYDEPKPGRPSKLLDQQYRVFVATMQQSPRSVGFEQAEWTPALVQEWLQAEFNVDYTRRHVRRLMAGIGDERNCSDS